MFKKHTLKNGLRVLVAPLGGTKAVTVLVLVQTGSKYEAPDTNGVSHFLEHMMFKGTKRRPTAKELSETLDRVGGAHNAFTGQDVTGYWVKVPAAHVALALDVVSDTFLSSLFQAKELERERAVILEELNMNRDNPQRYVWDVWLKTLWGEEPAGMPVGGTPESVRAIGREHVVQYFREHYVAHSTIVCIAGAVPAARAISLAKRYFGAIPRRTPPSCAVTHEHQTEPQALIETRETDQTHLLFGARAFSLHDPRRFTLSVLANLLGGMMSARLFVRIREQLGLAYYISTSAELDADSGFLVTAAGVANGKLATATKEILREYRRLTRELVPASELRKVKEHLRGQLTLALETSDEVASFVGEQEAVAGTVLTLEQQLKKIREVTPGDLRALAKFLFRPERLNIAVVGPHRNARALRAILAKH